MHMIPMWAPAVAKLLKQTPGVKVIIDHLARYAQGTPAEYEEVLKLGANKGVYMKFSGPAVANPQPLCKRIHQAFGLLFLRLAERLEEPVGVDAIEGVRVTALAIATAALFERLGVGFGQLDRGWIGRLGEGIGCQHRGARRHAALQVIDIGRQELQPFPARHARV